MTEADKSRQLSIEQENAIDLLIMGGSDRSVAEQVGVARTTITEWRNHNAEFAAELNRRRQEMWREHSDRLRSLVSSAIDVLEDDLANAPTPSLRQNAAVHILKAVRLYGEPLKPSGPTSGRAIRADWRSHSAMEDLLDSFNPAST